MRRTCGQIITHRLPVSAIGDALELFNTGLAGKIAIHP